MNNYFGLAIKLNGIDGDPEYIFIQHIVAIQKDPNVEGRTQIFTADGDPSPFIVTDDIENIFAQIKKAIQPPEEADKCDAPTI